MGFFGEANLDGRRGTTFFTIKKGEKGETGHNVFRLLPSYGALKASEKWDVFFCQHFGYRGVNPNDPTGDGSMRPFKCPREKDRKSGMVKVECAECLAIEKVKAQKEALEAQMKEAGNSKEEIKAASKEYNDWLRQHNLEKRFYVAAMNEKREMGILKMPYEAHQKLEKRIKELKGKGIHPMKVTEGVWFDFQRTGEDFMNTTYDVDIVYEEEVIQGRRLNSIKIEPLTEDDIAHAEAQLPELLDIPRVVTPQQVEELVASGGTPEEVDAILGIGKEEGTKETQRREATPQPPPAPKAAPKAAAAPPPASAPKAAPRPAPAAATPAPIPQEAPAAPAAEDDEEAALERQLAEARARKAAAKAATAKGPTIPMTPKSQAAPSGGIGSPEDFMKDFGFDPNASQAAVK